MADAEEELARTFLEFSCKKLTDEFWPRICVCLDSLTEEQVWWRPNEASNSIGNLLLHLNGNVRQWIVSGLVGEDDGRDRRSEFSERDHVPLSVLRSKLDDTLKEVDAVLGRLQGADLLRQHSIQGYDVTGLDAVYHVVEHFAMHYGQIVYVTKMLQSEDMGFYRHLN